MIGILDSGLGGLSVLREMERQLPVCDFLYFGDTAAGAIDHKSPGLVEGFVSEGLLRLEKMGARLLVVADHSAAACLAAETRKHLAAPVLDIITHGVVPAVASPAPGSLGIVGPPVVVTAGSHKRAVEEALPRARIYSAAAPLLSPLVDAGWLKKPETVMIVKKYLHFFKLRQVEALVLGSNHYLLMSAVIQRKIGKRVTLVNGTPELARGVKAMLGEHPELKTGCKREGTRRVVVSDLTDSMEKAARTFYGMNIRIERI